MIRALRILEQQAASRRQARGVTPTPRLPAPVVPKPDITRLDCPACGRTLRIGAKSAGREVSCPACGTRLKVAPNRKSLATAPEPGVNAGAPLATVGQQGSRLYLRILGTPYLYETPADCALITFGRQRRKAGQSAEEGNDLVIRVAGEDQKSLRISRRHLEIQRADDQYFVVDCSTAGTQLNGQRLTKGERTPVRSGDQLSLADVLTLEILVAADTLSGVTHPAVELASNAADNALVFIEASLGDLKTLEPNV